MSRRESTKYVADSGLVVLLGAATVEQTGMVAGQVYEFTSTGGTAICRWGADDASAADGGFDFAVPPGAVVRAICPSGDSAINIIEAEAGSTATAVVTITKVDVR